MLAKLQRLALCLTLCGLSACEVWLDVDNPQCKTNNDCVGLFGRDYTCTSAGVCKAPETGDAGANANLPERWKCAGQEMPGFIDDPDMTVMITMDAIDLATLRVPAGIKGRVCSATDYECKSPLVTDVGPGVDGYFHYELPYGFEGIIKYTAPDYVDSISMINRPYFESSTTSGPALLTTDSRDELAERAGYPVVDGRCIVILEMRDCSDKAGDGISFDPITQTVDGVEEEENPFYFEGALPSRKLTSTQISSLLAARRENRAVAGFSNIVPGFPSFTARLESNQAEIAKVVVPVFVDTTTYVRVYAGY